MRDLREIMDLCKFNRKTGELWFEDAGSARFISCSTAMVEGGKGTQPHLRASLADGKADFEAVGDPHAFILRLSF